MKVTEQQNQKSEKREAIKNAILALTELNPQIEFLEGDGCIYSSCETSGELLKLELPKGIVTIGDPEESACYGLIYVKIGEEKTSIKINGMD